MATEVSDALHQIVVYLGARSTITNNELFVREIAPVYLLFCSKWMVVGENSEDPFKPKLLRLTILPLGGSCDECDIKAQLPDGRDMVRRITIYQLDSHCGWP